MRVYHYTLETSKSGKSVAFKIHTSDRFGQKDVKCASVSGWRTELARKRLSFDQQEWDVNIARKFVSMVILKSARDKYEGIRFLNHVKNESEMEIHFWAYQFLTNGKAAARAWKTLNGGVQ